MVLASHGLAGLWTKAVLSHYVMCLPLTVLAFGLGHVLSRRISPQRFQKLVYLALIGIALGLLMNVLLGPGQAT